MDMSRKLGNVSAWDKIRALDEELATVNISLNFKGLPCAPIIPKTGLGTPEAAEIHRTRKRKEKIRGDIVVRKDADWTEDAHGPLLWRQLRAQVSTGRKRKSERLREGIACERLPA